MGVAVAGELARGVRFISASGAGAAVPWFGWVKRIWRESR